MSGVVLTRHLWCSVQQFLFLYFKQTSQNLLPSDLRAVWFREFLRRSFFPVSSYIFAAKLIPLLWPKQRQTTNCETRQTKPRKQRRRAPPLEGKTSGDKTKRKEQYRTIPGSLEEFSLISRDWNNWWVPSLFLFEKFNKGYFFFCSLFIGHKRERSRLNLRSWLEEEGEILWICSQASTLAEEERLDVALGHRCVSFFSFFFFFRAYVPFFCSPLLSREPYEKLT